MMIIPWWLDFFFLKMQFVSKSSNASLTKPECPNQKMANIIDISGEAKNLDCAFWIGRGKNYPKNPPPNLTAYRDSLYEIPDSWMKKLLPDRDMPIDNDSQGSIRLRVIIHQEKVASRIPYRY